MSELIYTSYRDTELISNRSILYNASEEDITDFFESMYLSQHKQMVNQLESKQAKLSEIREKLDEFPSTEKSSVEYKNLQAFASRVDNSIHKLDHDLSNLEQNVHLQRVLKREKQKLHKEAEQRGNEALERYREEATKRFEEVIKRNQEARAEALKNSQKREQPVEQPKQEEPTVTDNKLKYLLFRLFLMSLSLVFPLIMLEAPIFLIVITPFIVYSPLLFKSLAYGNIVYCLCYILRPILYVWGLIVAVQGEQDFFAIAFYILLGLQAIDIVKTFIATILSIILLFTYKE